MSKHRGLDPRPVPPGSTTGTNYLIPIDVKATEAGELWDQSLRLTEITRKLKTEAGNATHFVVFDACRSPLKLTRTGSRSLGPSPPTAVHIACCRSRAGDLMRAHQPVPFGLGGDQLREYSYDRSSRLNIGFAPQPPPIVRKAATVASVKTAMRRS